MAKTNLQRWHNILRHSPSPNSYIDAGFWFLISAALQRRVWLESQSPIYPNVYIGLVGRAGIGKGQVTTPVKQMLSYWKWDPADLAPGQNASDIVKGTLLPVTERERALLQKEEEIRDLIQKVNSSSNGLKSTEKEPLFPMAPDFITQQMLVKKMAGAKRRIEHGPLEARQIYTHSSMAFVLDELANLFEEHQKAMNAFLLSAYTCLEKYEHETITRKMDRITRPCVTMIAGLTPEFMREVFTTQMLSEGFASRTWFIFESAPRFREGFIPPLDEGQEVDKTDILMHLKNLSQLYGPVKQTPEALAFFNHWWRDEANVVVNRSIKLEDYYARKLMHVYKMAMIELFSDQAESFVLEKHHIQAAIHKLALIEQKMHIALNFTEGRNPLAQVSGKMLKYIMNSSEKQVSRNELYIEFYSDLTSMEELDSCVKYLTSTGALKEGMTKDGKAVVRVAFEA